MTLNDNDCIEFFTRCENYFLTWKIENKEPVELLFLQLLTFYESKFNFNGFVISIQTQMPILKIDKQKSGQAPCCAGTDASQHRGHVSISFHFPDPIDFNRNLTHNLTERLGLRSQSSVSYK